MQDPSKAEPITGDWVAHHFNHLSPVMATQLQDALATARSQCPVARSDQWGGFWLVSRYEDVLTVAQDWETFSSASGVTVPYAPAEVPAIPEMMDPPEHRAFKRIINAHFTPAVVARAEDATKAIVTKLIDAFIESGECEFMEAFANPLPGLVFFEQFIHAPAEDMDEINATASQAARATERGAAAARARMLEWIRAFVEQRKAQPPHGDVVDALLAAEIDGRPITHTELVGVIQLLLFGGLDTTAGALGQIMTRFCRQPEIPEMLRAHPERIVDAIEELLRLDPPFVFIARTATRDTELGGCPIAKGDKVLISWASANRDEQEFANAHEFLVDRPGNRHIAFGAGPHRCAGSNLARANLRIAITELVERLHDLRFAEGAEPIGFHSHFARCPAAVPIRFTPGARRGG